MNSKKTGERISYQKKANSSSIIVYPEQDKNKLTMLKLWLFAWSACGVVVITQLFADYNTSEKAVLVIYLALWAYFLIKITAALRWNLYGKETIEVDSENLIYTQLIGKRGFPKTYPVKDISNLKYVEGSTTGFLNSINQSFWIIGGEVIQFEFEDSIKRIGLKLSKSDSKKLIQLLNKYINK